MRMTHFHTSFPGFDDEDEKGVSDDAFDEFDDDALDDDTFSEKSEDDEDVDYDLHDDIDEL